jgi:hypothetical protein
MIRCYMGADRVDVAWTPVHQALIRRLPRSDSPAAQPGPRIMHGADAEPFQALRARWKPVDAADMEVLRIDAPSLRSSGTQISFMGRAPRLARFLHVLCEDQRQLGVRTIP